MFRLMKDHRGAVTVFVTLMLIPSVLFTGFMVDLARFKGALQMTENVNQLVGSSILSYYDGLLKDTYGLFAISKEPKVFSKITEYVYASLYPTNIKSQNTINTDKNIFNPYNNSFAAYKWDNLEGSTLNNDIILQNQIMDYMKYRAAVTFFEDNKDFSDKLENFDKLDEDSRAIQSKIELDELLSKIDELYEKFYKEMIINDNFDEGAERGTVDEIQQKADNITSLCEQIENLRNCPDEEEDEESIEDQIDSLVEEIKDRAKKAVNAQGQFADKMEEYVENIKKMKVVARDIESKTNEAKIMLNELRVELIDTSGELKNGMLKQLEEYDELFQEDFSVVPEKILVINKAATEAKKDHVDGFTYSRKSFESISSNAQSLNEDMGAKYNILSPKPQWLLSKDVAPKLYSTLNEWYGEHEIYRKKEKIEKEKEKKNLDQLKEKKEELKNQESKGAKFIPQNVYNMLSSGSQKNSDFNTKDDEVEYGANLANQMAGRVSKEVSNGYYEYQGLYSENNDKDLILKALNKVLLVEYDIGMFTCDTTGKSGDKKQESKDKTEEIINSQPESIEEMSLTGIPKSLKLNYMYSSELEYIYAGNETALQNRLAAQGTIYAMLYVRNFAYSYKFNELNNELKEASYALALGSPMEAKIIELSLRGIVTGLETANELHNLTVGNEISLVKGGWQCMLNSIGKDVSDKGKFPMDYEDFMRALMLMFVDSKTLTNRTRDLIEINLTNYQQHCCADESKMKDLTYDLSDSYTATQIMVSYKSPFIFPILEVMGLEDTISEKIYTIVRQRGY